MRSALRIATLLSLFVASFGPAAFADGPPKPEIIVQLASTPYVTLDGNAAIPSPMLAGTNSECAFGTKTKFQDDQGNNLDFVSLHFANGSSIVVTVDSSNNFVWLLNGQRMGSVPVDDARKWNGDLLSAIDGINAKRMGGDIVMPSKIVLKASGTCAQ